MPDRRVIWLAAGAILAALLLRVAFFAISVGHVPVSSDEAITMLQAEDIRRGQFPLLFYAIPYQFPLESYLISPCVNLLPHTPFGARILPALMSLAAVILGVLVFRKLGPLTRTWPGLLLILFPSAYFLVLQTANALPQHSTMILCSTLILYLSLLRPATLWGVAANALAAGLVGGLAFSNHVLVMPVVFMAGFLFCLDRGWQRALAAAPAFMAGALVGLIPYILAKVSLAGAWQQVTRTLPWQEAIGRLWDPMLIGALPGAMGIQPPFYPDNVNKLVLVRGLGTVCAVIWAGLLLTATIVRLWRFMARLMRDKWPSLRIADLIVGVCWLAVILFAMNRRSDGISYRYLLLTVLCFPFLLAYLYAKSPVWIRVPLGTLAVALAVFNGASATMLMRTWSQKDFGARETELYDTGPAMEFLRKEGIRHCFASHWLAYRMTFEAAGDIVFSQPFNERFFTCPVPYRDRVNASTNVAYVLAPRLCMTPEGFEADMKKMGVRSRKQTLGDITVYWDFRQDVSRNEERVPRDRLKLSASCNTNDIWMLADGDRWNHWRTQRSQEPGMWIEAALPEPMKLNRASLFYTTYTHDLAAALRISVRTAGGWQVVAENVSADLDLFEFVNGHPLYGDELQTIRFPPTLGHALRVEIVEAKPYRDWSVGEIELYRDSR